MKKKSYCFLLVLICAAFFISGCNPAIHVASYEGKYDKVRLLLKEGADVDLRNADQRTPLHFAVQEGHEEIVSFLIANGADVNAKTTQGWTPVHLAAETGQLNITKRLIDNGADLSIRNNDGVQPLHHAILNKHNDIASYMIEKGAPLEDAIANKLKRTPLHLAAEFGALGVTRLLVEKGADIEAEEGDIGATPLALALQFGQEDVADFLKATQDWYKIRQSNSRYRYESYIESHPKGPHLAKAQAQIDRLDKEQIQRDEELKREQAAREEKRKLEQVVREREEQLAREEFLKKIPDTVAEGAYVRTHRQNNEPLKFIGVAGEFVLHRILNLSKQPGRKRFEPQPKHPLIVEFVGFLGTEESINGDVGQLSVSGNISLYAKYTAATVDPDTDAIRKANPKLWIKLVDPRLHITSGGFKAAGTFFVGEHSIQFTEGGVITQTTSDRAFFMAGTKAVVDNDVYVFDGKTWSN